MFRSNYPFRVVLPTSRMIMAVRRITQSVGQKIKSVLPLDRPYHIGGSAKKPFVSLPQGIRFKLTLFVLVLIAVTAFSISFVVMRIMDQVLLRSLLQRGSAITQAIATPAGYSLLTNDRLALDNLAAQIKRSQKELVYVAILDLDKISLRTIT